MQVQVNFFEQLAKVLKVPMETKKQTKKEAEEYNLYGEGFKKGLIAAKEAYDKGDYTDFVEIDTKDLWK